MEKLQMAAHAIGDIEALLQGSDIGDGEDDAASSFEDRVLALVLAALAGKDTEAATRLAEKSIENAKAELEREEENINKILGSMDGAEYVGPRLRIAGSQSLHGCPRVHARRPSHAWR